MNAPPPANLLESDPIRRNGLVCWRDKDRPCSADCMAFAEPPAGPDYDGKQWANCSLLVNGHKTAKHLVILTSVSDMLVKMKKNEVADRARTNQPPPPKVV